jgi:hypothetical protein
VWSSDRARVVDALGDERYFRAAEGHIVLPLSVTPMLVSDA